MYCVECGAKIMEGAKFCSQCGCPAEGAIENKQDDMPEQQQENVFWGSIKSDSFEEDVNVNEQKDDKSVIFPAKKFDEIRWNVEEYPSNKEAKTEDIDFNWGESVKEYRGVEVNKTDVADIPGIKDDFNNIDVENNIQEETEVKNLEDDLFSINSPQEQESLSASERIDKFYTFNKRNEEFQQLLDKEYKKVKSGNVIGDELSQIDEIVDERFENRPVSTSMDDFLEAEGVVKGYEPKGFESDVLAKIEKQERAREKQREEEEQRLQAIEDARLEAKAVAEAEEEAKAKAFEEARELEEEAKAKAEEEARIALEEEARIALEEEAKAKAEEEARIALEEEAKAKAEEEARIALEEEAKAKAEEEAKAKAEKEAEEQRIAESEAQKIKEEQEALVRAEADLRAAQEAAKIRAQQEAKLAQEEEDRFLQDLQRRRLEEDEAQGKLEQERTRLQEQANQAAVSEEARRAIEQTARMKEEEQTKIRQAIEEMRGISNKVTPKELEIEEAHNSTKEQIEEMAKARFQYFAQDEEIEKQDTTKEEKKEEELKPELENRSIDLTQTRHIDKAAILSGLTNETKSISRADIKRAAIKDKDEAQEGILEPEEQFKEGSSMAFMNEQNARPIDFKDDDFEAFTLDDLENKTDTKDDILESLPSEADDVDVQSTMQVTRADKIKETDTNSFDDYGKEEAGRYMQEQATGFEDQQDFDDEEDALDAFAKKNKTKNKKNKGNKKPKVKKEGKKRSGGRTALKIVLAILVILLVVEIAGIGIRILAPQSKAAEFIDTQLNKVIHLFTGSEEDYSVLAAQVRTEPIEDKSEFISSQLYKNQDSNIKSITYDPNLKYDKDKYGDISDLVLSGPITLIEWGRDAENYPVYYDEQVVGQAIAFESQKYNLMKNGDESVLKMIKPGTELYKNVAALKGKTPDGAFEKLEIGEIRESAGQYYIWTRSTIGDTTTETVYSIYPEKKFNLKIQGSYEG